MNKVRLIYILLLLIGLMGPMLGQASDQVRSDQASCSHYLFGDLSTPIIDGRVDDAQIKEIAEQNDITWYELGTKYLQRQYGKLLPKLRFGIFVPEDEFFRGYMSRSRLDEAKKSGQQAFEVYGEDVAISANKANNYIDDLTNVDFQIRVEDIQTSHAIMVDHEKPVQQFVGKIFPFLRGVAFYPGALKKRMQFLSMYGEHHLTKAQIENILVHGFESLKQLGVFKYMKPGQEEDYRIQLWHLQQVDEAGNKVQTIKPIFRGAKQTLDQLPDGRFAGSMKYPSSKIIPDALKGLVDWTNEEIRKAKAGAKDARDPIDIAAIFRYAFVYLHPMVDGNGRTAKLWQNKILDVFNLLPAVTRWADVDLRLEDHMALLRLDIHETGKAIAKRSWETPPTVGNRAMGLEVEELAGNSHVTQGHQMKPMLNKIYYIGDKASRKAFILFEDGFFYHKGIPYVYRDGTMYPISDKAFVLYSMGGKTKKYKSKDSDKEYNVRERNNYHQQVYQANLALAERLRKGETPSIAVMPYSEVAKANDTFSLHLYPWQRDLLRYAINITEDPDQTPFATLVRNPGNPNSFKKSGQTTFETSFILDGQKMRPSQAIGQWALRELDYLKLGQDIKAMDKGLYEELEPKLTAAREKFHAAGRKIIEDFHFPELLKLRESGGQLSAQQAQALTAVSQRGTFEPSKVSLVEFANFYFEKGFPASKYLMKIDKPLSEMTVADLIQALSDSRKISKAERDSITASGSIVKLEELRELFAKEKAIVPGLLEKLVASPQLDGLARYMNISKLSIADFTEAEKEFGTKNVPAVRISNSARTNILGFKTEKDIADFFKRIPLLESTVKDIAREFTLAKKAKRKVNYGKLKLSSVPLAALAAQDGKMASTIEMIIDVLNKRIYRNEFEFRGFDEEFQRAFVDMVLHAASNRPLQTAFSTTTDPFYLFKPDDMFVDARMSNTIYFLSLPVKYTDVQRASKWRSQYEVALFGSHNWLRSRMMIKDQIETTQIDDSLLKDKDLKEFFDDLAVPANHYHQ